MAEDKRKPPSEYMKLAVEVMNNSVHEKRADHPSPYVGAVLVFPDGTIETACRGEYRDGDHAEYTLLDKKFRQKDLTGCWLFATLEPCSPGSRNAPKVPCSERIVNARISDVWFGEEDLALSDDKGGIKFLEENGVKVHPFDIELLKEIKEINKKFDEWALEVRNQRLKEKIQPIGFLYQVAAHTDIDSLSDEALQKFIDRSKLDLSIKSQEFHRELLENDLLHMGPKNTLLPTGNAILLFGKNPRNKFHQAAVKAAGQIQSFLRLAQANASSSTNCNGVQATDWSVRLESQAIRLYCNNSSFSVWIQAIIGL